jgi:hypothetical protein
VLFCARIDCCTICQALDFKPCSSILFFDVAVGKGSLGSPDCLLNGNKNIVTVIGVYSMGNIMDYKHSTAGVFCRYVKQIILFIELKMENSFSINVVNDLVQVFWCKLTDMVTVHPGSLCQNKLSIL